MRADAVERRNRIIEVASKEISRVGKHFTLEDVATNAEVGIATLYRNFPTRNDLVVACIFYLCDEVCAHLDSVVERVKGKGRSEVGSMWNMVSEMVPAGVNLLVPTLIDPSEDQLSEKLLEKKRQFVKSLSAVMEVARENGYVHETVPDNWVLNGLIHLYQPNSYDFTGKHDLPSDRNPLIAVFLEGCERGVNSSFWYKENKDLVEVE